jgi:hypothetical protein
MISSPQLLHQMLVEQFSLAHCKWKGICNFDIGLSMVNVTMMGNLQVGALKSYPFPHFRLHCGFSPHSYHFRTTPSSVSI